MTLNRPRPDLWPGTPGGPRPAARGPRSRPVSLALGLCLSLSAAADAGYAYQDRGDRAEGVRLPTAPAADLTLVSVRATPVGGPDERIPQRLRLRFVLPPGRAPKAVQITVRELHERFDYWLDQVRPAAPWQPGRVNEYRWPTRSVLKWLYGRGLQTSELGVLVRLTDADPRGTPGGERVAPAVLSGDDLPVAIERYLFTFRVRVPARVTCVLEPAAVPTPIWGQTVRYALADHSYSCRIPFPPLPAGDYRLRIESWSPVGQAPLAAQELRFFHDPDLR